MNAAEIVKELYGQGRYREALEAIRQTDFRRDPPGVQLLRAELFVIAGETDQAAEILRGVSNSRTLSEQDRGYLEFIRSRVAVLSCDFDSEFQFLHKSISYSQRAGDLTRTCWAQLRLVDHVADRSGPEAVAASLPALRVNVIKLGEPTVTAALHIIIGELNAKQGLVANALQHFRRAKGLLDSRPHLYLAAWCQASISGISILRGDFEQAFLDGKEALQGNIDCGSMLGIRRCLSNLGLIHFSHCQFDSALEHFNRVIENMTSTDDPAIATFENIARVYLVRGDFEGCNVWLERIDAVPLQLNSVGRYVERHCLLLKAQLFARLGRWSESLACAEKLITFAQRSGDMFLGATAKLFAAELYLGLNRAEDSRALIDSVSPSLGSQPPDIAGLYERAFACLLAATGDIEAGRFHRERARRIFDGMRNGPALIELSRSWDEAEKLGKSSSKSSVTPERDRTSGNLIQNIAALMLHLGRPELLAAGLIAALKDADCAVGAVAVSRDDAGAEEVLASFGTMVTDADLRTLTLGVARNRTVDVRIAPFGDIESQATINAVAMLVGTVHDLERAQIEREERLTLWPIDELPSEDDDSVITGRMRELMVSARKVARTNVTVLITGESGTGKEVLARAIHGFSARAKKAFVPFNCTAIPRELLESQLFGYRRGAFTGAERDNPGLIRAAKDGTLFLDEVGELGLDLQPKLLRFLESGEINPLGETSPFNVDVRIVAATNANLEWLVEQGRFREDLFYRLNVICLTIPPLRERRDEIPALVHHFVAKAAVEFGKGRMRVAEETMERLLLYSWPGNVRQLQNELRRMVALADADSTLTPGALSKSIRQETTRVMASGQGPELAVPLTEKLTPTITRIEREMIKVALRANHGRVEAAAKALGISRKGLYLKRQRLGV